MLYSDWVGNAKGTCRYYISMKRVFMLFKFGPSKEMLATGLTYHSYCAYYSRCQRTLAIAVSRIAGTMIIHVFGLCKFIAKFFHKKDVTAWYSARIISLDYFLSSKRQFEFWNAWIPCYHWDTEHFSTFWLFKTVIFRSFPFVGHLCLGVLNGSACLALSFKTIYSHQRSEMIPNAYQIAAHRNALRSRILRAQRLRPDFVLRCCSIIRIMLTNVATSNPSTHTLYGVV